MKEDTFKIVKNYYGEVLSGSSDLKTSACCISGSISKSQKEILKLIEPEIKDKFYGCGSPIPLELKGKTVLDLGCGTGRDVYLISYLVGEEGRVIGVDMTDKQIEVAKKYEDIQAKKLGYKSPNTEFKKGYIEDLKSLGIEDDSVDIVISNCVINLSPEKEKVFKEIFRILRPGGELHFSDVFSNSRISDELIKDPVLYGECLSGAMYIEDFRRMITQLGFPDYRILAKRKMDLENLEIEKKVGMIDFYSMTIRVFNVELEDVCEDYGQIAKYIGTIEESPHFFILDDHHKFIAHKPMLVCGNTANMLKDTRFKKHFEIIGDKSRHFGKFDCAPVYSKSDEDSMGGGCC
ncbi:methyltransferase domain-containing protein [archaeon]|jgi:arsenite methyltransferase|nr:methyltransferase domain-containing protein [archaeon]MBT4352377.1 methyltransferase domain-containing protein [archaeon]MBT4646628.1 methyltransferase domain-containing protein [archaeon]MBT6821922.1 methyltransferase domain-containing protein [archaeon]MBT7393189.1 methyltransferase domain-containing protein [archaeon]